MKNATAEARRRGAPPPSNLPNPFPDTIADAWGEQADLQSLNATVSDDLAQRIEALSGESRAGQHAPRSQCVLLLGPAGSGKTHLFARLRKRLGHRAVFFHTRPELGAPATPRYLLAQLVDALRQRVLGTEHTQLDLVAGAMLSVIEGQSTKYSLTLIAQPHDDPRLLVERAIQVAEKRYPQLSAKYLERLLLAPFDPGPQSRRAAYSWLSGRPPSEAELARLGEAQGLGDEDILPALKTLGFAAAFGAPIVLVFDQLENLADDDPTRGRLMAHAQLVAELRDTMPGMLILQMVIDSEWTRFMRPALPPQFLSRIQETELHLLTPTEEQARELLHIHLDKLPPEARQGPFPWPLDPVEVQRWTRDSMTPRALLQRCKSAFDDFLAGRDQAVRDASAPGELRRVDERLEVLWTGFLEKARAEIDRAAQDGHYLDSERIASGLLAALPLRGAHARRAPGKKNRPDVRIVTSPASLVLIAQQNHHLSLGALLAEAAQADKERVIVLREHSFVIPPTWKQVHGQIAVLRSRKNVVYSTVGREELASWLAAESMLSAARSKDLSDEQGRIIEYDIALDWLRRHARGQRSSVLDTVLQAVSEPATDDERSARPEPTAPQPRAPSERQSAPPVAEPRRTSPSARAPTGAPKSKTPPPPPVALRGSEDEELELLVLSQLQKLGVAASVPRRVVGARLIRLEVSTPRQRVSELDRAAADVEHKMVEHQVRFEREGPRRFFNAPRRDPRPVLLDDLLRKEEPWLRERPGRFVLGERIDGDVVRGDLTDGGSCHLLVAGQTGSGKSLLLRAIVIGLARFHPPSRIRFTLGDPKRVTFGPLSTSLAEHLALPICHDAESIVTRLENLAARMDERFTLFERGGVENIHEHNTFAVEKLPVEVVVIDEFADLIFDKAYKQPFLEVVKRIGNMGRAAGIHMVLATQRPDRNTIPGDIKNNLVGKVALKVQSALNSRIILDENGAEKLLGKGDLLADVGHGVVRAQAPMT